jgi:predicted RNA-binding Zn ribbon-like protein
VTQGQAAPRLTQGSGGGTPAERTPAPGDLAVVQAFVNTNDIEGGDERLGDPDALGAWLAAAGLCEPGVRVTRAEFRVAMDIREGLRDLGSANNGEPLDRAALERLNGAVQRIPLSARFSSGEWHPQRATEGVSGALAWIVGAVMKGMSDGAWSRMKACKRDRCRWLFYDHSRNRSAVWCRMEVCGNKEKAMAYRKRQRARLQPPSP